MSTAETPEVTAIHDDQCESEFIVAVGMWTGCMCRKRRFDNITSIAKEGE